MDDQRPKLIPPLVQSDTALELVRERPQAHREVEHPHCDEHFLFTPHCAACLEAERTQSAKAKATPIETQKHEHAAKPLQSSRSFGFTDNIPPELTHEPTFIEQMARSAATNHSYDSDPSIVDILLDI